MNLKNTYIKGINYSYKSQYLKSQDFGIKTYIEIKNTLFDQLLFLFFDSLGGP
jgi:hypothetical protein